MYIDKKNLNQKIKNVIVKLKDERSRKVVIVSHCVLNQNTRYLGGAFRKGAICEVVDDIKNQGIGIVQMKCPERIAMGGVVKRWEWRIFDSKHTLLYKFRKIALPVFLWNTKRIYKKLAKEVVKEIQDYLEYDYEVIGIIGIGASPSCGVKTSVKIKNLIEFLAISNMESIDRKKFNEEGVIGAIVEGTGMYIQALQNEIRKNNMKISFYELDWFQEMSGERIVIDDIICPNC